MRSGEEVEVVALSSRCERSRCSASVEVVVVGVAGGADAGCSVEGVDFEAGVVGDDDFAGGVVGVVDGLEAGVAFEGGFVFGVGRGFRSGPGSGVRVMCRRGGGGEVAELAGVGGGDVEGCELCALSIS